MGAVACNWWWSSWSRWPETPACGTLRAFLQWNVSPCWKSIPWFRNSRISRHAPTCLGGIFDFANRKDRLAEVELELAEPTVWDDPERAQDLGRERATLDYGDAAFTLESKHLRTLGPLRPDDILG